jgi:hypothetical protein
MEIARCDYFVAYQLFFDFEADSVDFCFIPTESNVYSAVFQMNLMNMMLEMN